jgi:hypothetical protein
MLWSVDVRRREKSRLRCMLNARQRQRRRKGKAGAENGGEKNETGDVSAYLRFLAYSQSH